MIKEAVGLYSIFGCLPVIMVGDIQAKFLLLGFQFLCLIAYAIITWVELRNH